MTSDFMDRFRFNTENAPDVFYIQNLKKKPTETFREYATRWKSEAAKVRPSFDEEHMNKFFAKAHDPQYYERLMVIENHRFSNIIKLGEMIEEGIKSGMVTKFEALQATNKALQLGGILKKRDVGAVMVAQGLKTPLTYQTPLPTYETPPPTYQTPPTTYQASPPTYQPSSPRYFQPPTVHNTYNSQPSHFQSPPICQNYPRPRPNFDRMLPRQHTAIADPIDQLYEKLKAASYVTHVPAVALENPSQWVNPNKTYAYRSSMKGHTTVECRTLKDKIQTLIDNKVIQAKEAAPNVRNNPLLDHKGNGTQAPIDVEVTISVPFEVEVASPAATSAPFEVEVVTTFTVTVSTTPPFNSKAIPWDYVVEARRKRKTKIDESNTAHGMTRTGRVYTPEHLGGSSKVATTRQPVIETGLDDLWRKVHAKEYSIVYNLNKAPAHISILSLLQNLEAYKNALMKILSEAYVPNIITGGEMANMVGQVLDSHKIIFHEDELPPEGLNHNRALHNMGTIEEEALAGLKDLFLEDENMDCCAIIEKEEEGLTIQTAAKGAILRNWIATPSRAGRVPG
ncbi:uncharacterized protein [Nicotiana sylvestris]|uniref:uncharacterized protein n=1 Tax=Nicotiana sylvestris TaxID=4096 RepID=UPI00388CE318